MIMEDVHKAECTLEDIRAGRQGTVSPESIIEEYGLNLLTLSMFRDECQADLRSVY